MHWLWLVYYSFIMSGSLALIVAAEPNSGIEGAVKFVRPISAGRLELELASDTNRIFLDVENSAGNSPALSSRILETGATPGTRQPGLFQPDHPPEGRFTRNKSAGVNYQFAVSTPPLAAIRVHRLAHPDKPCVRVGFSNGI